MAGRPVLIIGGPTASGKSGLAVTVAEEADGVVINADSLQVYAGLPLLTAQPPDEDKAKVPHALYGTLDPSTEMCSAGRWRDMALEEIEKAQAAGKLPVIVGGTGLYIKALTEGLSPMPEVAPEYREEAAAMQRRLGNPAFHEELKKRDPETAAKLDPMNTQRNVRAWEVLIGTGRPLAQWQSEPLEPPPAHLRFITAVLAPEREALYDACERRFDMMMKSGALDEAAAFPYPESPLSAALGFKELRAHIAGTMSLDAAIVGGKQATRNYAKRQTTWFRNQVKPDAVLHSTNTREILRLLKI